MRAGLRAVEYAGSERRGQREDFRRPSGTRSGSAVLPALKRRAIVGGPSGAQLSISGVQPGK
jgi:hypothetical protein